MGLMRRKSKEQKLKEEYITYYKKNRMKLGRNMPTYAQWKKSSGKKAAQPKNRTEAIKKAMITTGGTDWDKERALLRKRRGAK